MTGVQTCALPIWVQFGESIYDTLKREFREETGLEVDVQDFLFFHEHISGHIHAVELFFSVRQTGGVVQLGNDPELPPEKQILTELRLWTKEEIADHPPSWFHARIRQMNF